MRYLELISESDKGTSQIAKAVSDAATRKSEALRTYQGKLRLAKAAEANARSSNASSTRTNKLAANQQKRADAAATYQASIRRADDAIRRSRQPDR